MYGGKDTNLLTLAELSQGRDFSVPAFQIIPIGAQYTEEELELIYQSLAKPLDGIKPCNYLFS